MGLYLFNWFGIFIILLSKIKTIFFLLIKFNKLFLVSVATIFPLFNNIESGIYDVGTGKEESFERVLTLMNIEYEYHDESVIPVGYQFKTKADETYFMKDWKPKVSLEAGIKIYLDYLKTGI